MGPHPRRPNFDAGRFPEPDQNLCERWDRPPLRPARLPPLVVPRGDGPLPDRPDRAVPTQLEIAHVRRDFLRFPRSRLTSGHSWPPSRALTSSPGRGSATGPDAAAPRPSPTLAPLPGSRGTACCVGKDSLAVGLTGIASNACSDVANGRRLGWGSSGRAATDAFLRQRPPAARESGG
jgi:hypothetical protein